MAGSDASTLGLPAAVLLAFIPALTPSAITGLAVTSCCGAVVFVGTVTVLVAPVVHILPPPVFTSPPPITAVPAYLLSAKYPSCSLNVSPRSHRLWLPQPQYHSSLSGQSSTSAQPKGWSPGVLVQIWAQSGEEKVGSVQDYWVSACQLHIYLSFWHRRR